MSTASIVKTRTRSEVKEPRKYRVIYINDDVTTAEFVISTLLTIFGKSNKEAEDITVKIHEEGSAIVAVLPYEIAEQKGIEVQQLAKHNYFPLVVKLEIES